MSPSADLKGKGQEGSGPVTSTVSGLSKRDKPKECESDKGVSAIQEKKKTETQK